MIRTISSTFYKGRWFFAMPVVFFALFNAYLGVIQPRGDEMRAPQAFERESLFENVDIEEAKRADALRLESRPVGVQFGADVAPEVKARLKMHLQTASTQPVEVLAADAPVEEFATDWLLIGIGETTISDALIAQEEREELADEGYILRSGALGEANAIATAGGGTARGDAADVGTLYGAYALLEKLGFGFLHPIEPTVPLALPGVPPEVDRTTSPRWPIRGLQLHTMHPLEFTDLLQGFGPGGPDDVEGWEAMLEEWDVFLEWLIANGQNMVHWVWLRAPSWSEFADSQERMDRIKRVVDRAHAFGIEAGLDVPIRFQQQNSGRLIMRDSTLEDEVRQIEEGVAHVMQAGFDYLVTEMGTTEFTDVEDQRMLAWMNAMTRTAEEDHGVSVYVKVHTSVGQYADNFPDPETGTPTNFNFLAQFADERLGVLPHTVQHYSLSDPAPTYGNEDFSHIHEFLKAQAGSRPTVWFPETAYWVSFDVDVPLFLPVYASRRVHDLRLLAMDEEAGRMGRGEHVGASMDGQLTFSSGWEWGYWIQEVVTARAAWDPRIDLDSDNASLAALLEPVKRVFGEAGEPLVEWLVEYAQAQLELLIEGRVDGEAPEDIFWRNGQAYLQGWETWDDISHRLADRFGLEKGRMQPARVGFVHLRRHEAARTAYAEHVAPLLSEMEERFEELAIRLEGFAEKVPVHAKLLYKELVDSAQITALRARQVRGLYAYTDAKQRGLSSQYAKIHLQAARDALDHGLKVVADREQHYRVPAERIAAWRENPTVYPFTYLWTARSLFYWQRDEAKAVTGSRNPCLFNIIDPLNVVVGDGGLSAVTTRVSSVLGVAPALTKTTTCMRAPQEEPDFLPADWRGLH